jgi:hypothetical protein
MFGKKPDNAPPTALPGRNDPCHCGSGKKYKKCCQEKDAEARHATLEKQWTEAEKAAAKKAEEEKKAAEQHPTASPKPAHEPPIREHHHKTPTIPKFNMPRRIGGG